MNDLGADGSAYENAYTIKNNEDEAQKYWQKLADASHNMGTMNPSEIAEDLGEYLDIDAALWMIASENLFGDDDGYINKGGMDYYVYFDEFTQRILPVEYDGNSVLKGSHLTWSPLHKEDNDAYPLIHILLNIPELRQRYLAHYRTLIEEAFDPNMVDAKIDAYESLINSAVEQASVRLYDNNQYRNGVNDLRQAIQTRYNSVTNNNEVNRTGPGISNVSDSVKGMTSVRPKDTDSVDITATVNGASRAYLYYGTGLAGRFTKMEMSLNGNNATATIPAQEKGEYVRYYIEAIANDGNNTASFSPKGAEHDVYVYQVQAANDVSSPVVINELMADNETVVSTPEGEYSDWVELYNNSNTAVDLSGYYLTDEDSKLDRWAFPGGTSIPANGTLVVWLDDDEDLVTALHANFNLSKDGESLYLVTPEMEFADRVTFGEASEDQSYARSPNGTGDFEWTNDPSFNQAN